MFVLAQPSGKKPTIAAMVSITTYIVFIFMMEDVNGDGLPDMVLHVATGALALSDTAAEAALEGKTVSGTPIIGKDSVVIVK